jgi:hypothetical protein
MGVILRHFQNFRIYSFEFVVDNEPVCYHGVFLERLRSATRNLKQDSQGFGRDLKPTLRGYKPTSSTVLELACLDGWEVTVR